MLIELVVRNLGVIEELSLLLGHGMTAVTGETGAGKTLVVDAINLLAGGRADIGLVRPGADHAEIEGRFVTGASRAESSLAETEETVVRRVIPQRGRSRGYVDGRLATVRELSDLGRSLVEVHAQHAHQSLLKSATQRAALDRFGGVDTSALAALRDELRRVDAARDALGGDERARAREIDLLRYQLAEIAAAAIEDPDEDERLDAAEAVLADAAEHRLAAQMAVGLLNADGPVADGLGRAVSALAGRAPFAALLDRLVDAEAEIADTVSEIRAAAEAIDDDPAALTETRERRHTLAELRRKYGSSLAEVIGFASDAARHLAELENRDEQAAALDVRRADTERAVAAEQVRVRGARAGAAPRLAAAVQSHLRGLAMEKARVGISVDGAAGERVTFLLAANPGHEPRPLAQAASGGELTRAMLALRLVLVSGPPTLVFDEVDAGVGGAAAHAVGRSLAALDGQVLVVTHLAQVAAHADHHLLVEESGSDGGGARVSGVRTLTDEDRVVEMSRMLSGMPHSDTARRHAEELLATAAACTMQSR